MIAYYEQGKGQTDEGKRLYYLLMKVYIRILPKRLINFISLPFHDNRILILTGLYYNFNDFAIVHNSFTHLSPIIQVVDIYASFSLI